MRITKNIAIGEIDIDRYPHDSKTLSYAAALQAGFKFPPIKVFPTLHGRFQIKDGRHRLLAHKMCGKQFIQAKFAQVALCLN